MLGKPLLFLSSYSPLFGLLAIRFVQPYLWIPCVSLAVLGVGSLWLLLHLDSRSSPGAYALTSVQDAGVEAAAYLASYLLPFLTVPTPSARDVAAYVGFILVAATISVRSSVAQVNPLLYLFGYRVLAVTSDRGLRAYLITRRKVASGTVVQATRFGEDVLVDKSREQSEKATDALR